MTYLSEGLQALLAEENQIAPTCLKEEPHNIMVLNFLALKVR